ncbi:hypothetical protein BC829DRAFT_383818, partial [Chytridium lagenaria]
QQENNVGGVDAQTKTAAAVIQRNKAKKKSNNNKKDPRHGCKALLSSTSTSSIPLDTSMAEAIIARAKSASVKKAVGIAEACMAAFYKLILDRYRVDVDTTSGDAMDTETRHVEDGIIKVPREMDNSLNDSSKLNQQRHTAHCPSPPSNFDVMTTSPALTSIATPPSLPPLTHLPTQPFLPYQPSPPSLLLVPIPSLNPAYLASTANISPEVLMCLSAHASRVRLMATLAASDTLCVPGCPHVLRYALALVKRMLDVAFTKPVSSHSSKQGLPPSLQSPPRLLLAGIILAHASLSDRPISTVTWARVFGASVGAAGTCPSSNVMTCVRATRGDMAKMKMDALEVLEYRTWVGYEEYCKPLSM